MRLLAAAATCATMLGAEMAIAAPRQVVLSDTQSTAPEQLVRLTWDGTYEASHVLSSLQEAGIGDVWTANATSALVRVPPHAALFRSALPSSLSDAIQPQVIADSIETLLQDDASSTQLARPASDSSVAKLRRTKLRSLNDEIHEHYHPNEGINEILREMERQFPDLAQVVKIGSSSEGREILGLKVTNRTHGPGEDALDVHYQDSNGFHTDKHNKGRKKLKRKLGFVIIAGQHAREWIAPSTALYLAHDLLLSAQTAEVSSLLKSLEFTFVPVSNPDGYEYTWAPDGDRLWRKNRQPTGDDCFGLDLNRQWGYHWAPGSRPNPCSDAYPGREPFEAPELQALRDYLTDKHNNVYGFVDLHSFGQMIMYPFSYTCERSSPDEENHFEAVIGAAKAVRAVHGKQFETGPMCQVTLTAPGDSIDWTYAVAKIRWSFAIELRGSVWGFLLPANQIRPSGEEMSVALHSLATFVVEKETGSRRFYREDE